MSTERRNRALCLATEEILQSRGGSFLLTVSHRGVDLAKTKISPEERRHWVVSHSEPQTVVSRPVETAIAFERCERKAIGLKGNRPRA